MKDIQENIVSWGNTFYGRGCWIYICVHSCLVKYLWFVVNAFYVKPMQILITRKTNILWINYNPNHACVNCNFQRRGFSSSKLIFSPLSMTLKGLWNIIYFTKNQLFHWNKWHRIRLLLKSDLILGQKIKKIERAYGLGTDGAALILILSS